MGGWGEGDVNQDVLKTIYYMVLFIVIGYRTYTSLKLLGGKFLEL